MSEEHPQENVGAVGVSNTGMVHFVRTENGEPVYEATPNRNGNIKDGYYTFCGEYLELEDVYV